MYWQLLWGLLIFAVLIAIDAFCLKLVLKITANDAPMRDCALIVSIAWVLEIILRLVLGAFSGVLCGWIVFFILLKKISDADFYELKQFVSEWCKFILQLVYHLSALQHLQHFCDALLKLLRSVVL